MSRVEDELDALITDSGYDRAPQSRVEAILDATIDGTEYADAPQSVIEEKLLELKAKIEEGGGGGSEAQLPEFTSTVIATGTSDGTVTFTEDYHNYPLFFIKCVNSAYETITNILCSPSMVDSVFDLPASSGANDLVVNECSNDQYANYHKNDLTTWTRRGVRNLYISEVIGLNCTNFNISETEIYNKGFYDTSFREITGSGLLAYNMLLVASSVDGIQPNAIFIVNDFGDLLDAYSAIVTPYNRSHAINISDTKMTSAPYHYIGGIKFVSKSAKSLRKGSPQYSAKIVDSPKDAIVADKEDKR